MLSNLPFPIAQCVLYYRTAQLAKSVNDVAVAVAIAKECRKEVKIMARAKMI
jgi:hypothetical protein